MKLNFSECSFSFQDEKEISYKVVYLPSLHKRGHYNVSIYRNCTLIDHRESFAGTNRQDAERILAKVIYRPNEAAMNNEL